MLRELINKNIAPNLWDFHPPYQMDGNCGYTSGVCEMLCYSSDDIIELLPALPEEWKNGSVKGFVPAEDILLISRGKTAK